MLLRNALLAAAMSIGSASAALADWSEAKTRHFIIYSEQSPADLKAYAERLERFDAAVRKVRGMDDPELSDGAKVTIYVLPNQAAVQRLHSHTGTGVMGFYIGRAEGSIAFVPTRLGRRTRIDMDTDHVFQHEYLHHLQLSDQKFPLASWMVEGMAEFFGTAEVQDDGTVRIGKPPLIRGGLVLEDIGFTTEQLLTNKAPTNAYENESIYGKGWLLTHYLAFSKERAGQLTRYTAALAKGDEPLATARNAFGDLTKLESELDRYARGSFGGLQVPPGPRPATAIRPLRPGEAAMMQVRMRSEVGVNKNTAKGVAEDARSVAGRYPNDPVVQGWLAEIELDAGNHAAALAAADRALAAEPNHLQALIYKGRALAAQAKEAKEKGAAANWADARSWYVRANRVDPEIAEPLYLFYQSYKDAGETPTKSASEGLIYAHALAPQDRNLRYATARQLLVDRRVAEAEPIFSPLAFNPHTSAEVQKASAAIMSKIRARDGAGALALMEAEEKKAKEKAEADRKR